MLPKAHLTSHSRMSGSRCNFPSSKLLKSTYIIDFLSFLNRFKGLDLIDRVPDELWTQVRDTVQETGIKTIPKEKKCKKAKRLSEKALQIAERRREAKSKEEKERYTHLNAEFQRIARRDKKPSSVNNAKKQENNRMGKTRDLFKKIRDTKGTFHAKMDSIKDRNSRELAEAAFILRRGGKNTENCTKNIFMTQITMMV